MNAKLAKKIRKATRKEDHAFLAKFSAAVQDMGFRERCKLAWQILTKTFGQEQKKGGSHV